MIAKRVKRETGSNFKRLAKYIADASDEGEKLDDFWIVNSIAGESLNDLDLAIIDIEITQNKNIRTTQDKTYHLIVSFRNDKPDRKALKDIECEFAKALGLEEHQRVVGTHQNTDNFHMHIAYNKVDPKNHNIKTPFQEFKKLSKVCRAIQYACKFDIQYYIKQYGGKSFMFGSSSGRRGTEEANSLLQLYRSSLQPTRDSKLTEYRCSPPLYGGSLQHHI